MIIISAQCDGYGPYNGVYEEHNHLVKKQLGIKKINFTSAYHQTSFCPNTHGAVIVPPERTRNDKNDIKVGHLKYTDITEGYTFPTRYLEGVLDEWLEYHSTPTEITVHDNPLYCTHISNLSYLHEEIEDKLGYDIPRFIHGHLPLFEYEGQYTKVKLIVFDYNDNLQEFDLLYYCRRIITTYHRPFKSSKNEKNYNYISVEHRGYFVEDLPKHRKICRDRKKRFFAEGRGKIFGHEPEYTNHDCEMSTYARETMAEAGWRDNICCYANA